MPARRRSALSLAAIVFRAAPRPRRPDVAPGGAEDDRAPPVAGAPRRIAVPAPGSFFGTPGEHPHLPHHVPAPGYPRRAPDPTEPGRRGRRDRDRDRAVSTPARSMPRSARAWRT